jgi:hypothetical protein
MNNLIPISISNTDIHVDSDRRVIYRKIHKYGRKEYLIELSKTKAKYFIISIRMNKDQKTQVLQYHHKQGKKLIKAAGGLEALADRIKFKYGTLSILDLNKLLYQTSKAGSSMKNLARKGHTAGVKSKADNYQMMTTNR